tara:strand:+ start:414 stop:1292 length:879 start_codon:yes stop_codon:yes gene_type:complete
MPTTNNNFSTLITAIDTKAQSLAASTTDPKDLVYLGKTLEALNVSTTVADIISQGDTQVTRVTTEGTTQVGLVTAEGTTQVAAVQSAASGYATQSDIDTSVAALVDSAPGTLNTLNELAAALGDDANFSTTITNSIATKLPLAGGTLTGALTTTDVDVNGTLKIDEVMEKATIATSTSGTINLAFLADGAVVCFFANQTANRTINFRGDGSTTLDSIMAVGESLSCAVLMAQGSTAYYLNAYQIDGSSVTPMWQGGSAPTSGNASGIDVYTFTLIKTGGATFKLLASVAQFA